MKKTFVVSLLASVALLGASGCASDQGQKPEETKKPEEAKKPKDNRPIDQRLGAFHFFGWFELRVKFCPSRLGFGGSQSEDFDLF
jgi:hypothetical protein